ncbi:MAG TPA: hypothetical protein PLC26_06810, partial [Bacillota bacterium]|nr:hypothetical protein [Bacillota bacterium]
CKPMDAPPITTVWVVRFTSVEQEMSDLQERREQGRSMELSKIAEEVKNFNCTAKEYLSMISQSDKESNCIN